jgi:hypothetical protein
VRIVTLPDGDGGAKRRDLREGEIDEDDAALYDVQPEIGVDASNDRLAAIGAARNCKIDQSTSAYFPVICLSVEASVLTSKSNSWM